NTEKQLQYFKSLCREIKQRRRGVASILRLCQHLLDDRETCNLNADHQPMQLIIVNLERRWEAIVMQAVQWQTRLQKKMGKESVSDVFKCNGLSFSQTKNNSFRLGNCVQLINGFTN
ncbi:LOW QUALITY PROTEIN: AKAP6 isoform 15, partial [Pongo abelii]